MSKVPIIVTTSANRTPLHKCRVGFRIRNPPPNQTCLLMHLALLLIMFYQTNSLHNIITIEFPIFLFLIKRNNKISKFLLEKDNLKTKKIYNVFIKFLLIKQNI